MEFFKVEGKGRQDEPYREVQTVCPGCGKDVLLKSTGLMDLSYDSKLEIALIGLRKCPIFRMFYIGIFYRSKTPRRRNQVFIYIFSAGSD